MRNHFWVPLSLSQSQLWLVGDGCPQLLSNQEYHRKTVVTSNPQSPGEGESDWLSLGQVSSPGPISCGRGWDIGHNVAMGVLSVLLALEAGSVQSRDSPVCGHPKGRFLHVHPYRVCNRECGKLDCLRIMVCIVALGNRKVFPRVE